MARSHRAHEDSPFRVPFDRGLVCSKFSKSLRPPSFEFFCYAARRARSLFCSNFFST